MMKLKGRPDENGFTRGDPQVTRSFFWHKTNAALRLAVLRGATRPFASNIIVNEYPKSGGSWLSQMLGEATGLPFPRRRFPKLTSSIMQCHVLRPTGMRNVVVIWRDGRDIMVSYYHHLVIGQKALPPNFHAHVLKELDVTDPLDIAANLPRFVERMLTRPLSPSFTWPAFVNQWFGRKGVVSTRYEDLLTNPEAELGRIVRSTTGQAPDSMTISNIVSRYSFVSQSGRTPGEEDPSSFLRKGIAGDWHNHFSKETSAIFDHYAGDELRKLGYEV